MRCVIRLIYVNCVVIIISIYAGYGGYLQTKYNCPLNVMIFIADSNDLCFILLESVYKRDYQRIKRVHLQFALNMRLLADLLWYCPTFPLIIKGLRFQKVARTATRGFGTAVSTLGVRLKFLIINVL